MGKRKRAEKANLVVRNAVRKCAVFIVALCVMFGAVNAIQNMSCGVEQVWAAKQMSKKLIKEKGCFDGGSSSTFYESLTSSGKKNKIEVCPDWENEEQFGKVRVYVDGKKALTIKSPYYDEGMGVNCQFIRMSKNRKFLQIFFSGLDNSIFLNNLYRYSAKTHKLKKVGTLKTQKYLIEANGVGSYVTKVTSDSIEVPWIMQPSEIGPIEIVLMYKYKNGRFAAAPTAVKVKSLWYEDNKNLFRAVKSLAFYKKTDLRQVAFRIKKGDLVKLTKVRLLKDGRVYYQFKKGNRTGWRKARKNFQMYSDWFEGIHYGG